MNVNYDPKDHKSSEASFRKAVEVNPNEPEAYINLGIVLYDCGKLEEGRVLSTNKPFISTPVAPTLRGGFARQEVDSDRIQQLQQQIEAWQALLEKLGGNE